MSNYRLHNKSNYRGGQPKPGEVFNISSIVSENAACIGILKSEAKLYPKKSKTHVENLPEGQSWFGM
jgi:hypothetical protein